jgi:hypothetical protein
MTLRTASPFSHFFSNRFSGLMSLCVHVWLRVWGFWGMHQEGREKKVANLNDTKI